MAIEKSKKESSNATLENLGSGLNEQVAVEEDPRCNKRSLKMDKTNTSKKIKVQHEPKVKMKRARQTESKLMQVRKRRKFTHGVTGFKWKQNSCAYDTLFTILKQVKADCPTEWSGLMRNQNEFLQMTDFFFSKAESNEITWDETRDNIRTALHTLDPTEFTLNTYTDIMALVSLYTRVDSGTILQKSTCQICGTRKQSRIIDAAFWSIAQHNNGPKLSTCLAEVWKNDLQLQCKRCK
jgi:hypothetical protein